MPPRLLIITAAYGEGHNSAARNLALALDARGAVTRVADPCKLGAPFSTNLLGHGYRLVTTYSPRLWARIYRSTDRADFRKPVPLMRKPEECLGKMVEEFQADAVICTYPLYPYFLQRIFKKTGRPVPVYTVVTDSIEINAAWRNAPTDHWLVTDPLTRECMIKSGLPAAKVVDTGFPVNPIFSTLQPVEADDPCDPFRVLFFPTAKLVRRIGKTLLESSPNVKLTIVLGRNVRLLWNRAKELRTNYPGRVRIIGWTKRVPELLNSHHLIVGKAGGATVHEAIAARCPMLIHHLVPGQEEGNLRLLEAIGAGSLASSLPVIQAAMSDLLADNGARWKQMKLALVRHGRNAGALHAASYILDTLAKDSGK